MDREACHAAVHALAKSWTRLSDQTELNSTELVHSIKIPPDYLLKPSSYFQLGHFFLSLGLFFSLIISVKARPYLQIHWQLGLQYMNFGEHKHSVHKPLL